MKVCVLLCWNHLEKNHKCWGKKMKMSWICALWKVLKSPTTVPSEIYLPLLLPFKQGDVLKFLNSRSVCYTKCTTLKDQQFLPSYILSKELIRPIICRTSNRAQYQHCLLVKASCKNRWAFFFFLCQPGTLHIKSWLDRNQQDPISIWLWQWKLWHHTLIFFIYLFLI